MKMEAKEAGLKFREITEETCKKHHNTLICEKLVAKQNNGGHLFSKRLFSTNLVEQGSKGEVAKQFKDGHLFSNYDNNMELKPNAQDEDVHDNRRGGKKFLLGPVYRSINFVTRFEKRDIGVVVSGDKIVKDEPILLLDIVLDRMKHLVLPKEFNLDWVDSYKSKKYRPEHLKGIPFKIVNSSTMSIGEKEYKGIDEYFEEYGLVW